MMIRFPGNQHREYPDLMDINKAGDSLSRYWSILKSKFLSVTVSDNDAEFHLRSLAE